MYSKQISKHATTKIIGESFAISKFAKYAENYCKYRGKYTRKSEIAKFVHRGYELQARYNRTPLISIYVKIFSKEIQEWYTHHFIQTLDHASCRISPKKRDFEHVLDQTHHLGCLTRCCLSRKKRWSFHSRFVLPDSQRRRARCCPKIVKVATALPTARHSTIKNPMSVKQRTHFRFWT